MKASSFETLLVWYKYSISPEHTKDYLINPKVIAKLFDG
jgi:hypothetical protein